jgi:hypothetical protein
MPIFTMNMNLKTKPKEEAILQSNNIPLTKSRTYTLTSLGKRNCVPLQAMGNKKCSSCGSKR